ncbi:hypothetical protein KIM372_01010 [Bombiscardovia nodaiensis]|uniref:Phage P1-related protein n=1 Tax=Bombiscardovia nodaiensis TaxID=2932181 RepID=A0ABM8B5U2_9BIFI|nr:hypothetical protein KIM372_01010 [Bombiscardovia nodaiensis]
MNPHWLPDIVSKEKEETELQYQGRLYQIFENDFIFNTICCQQLHVKTKKFPETKGYPQAFIHLTTRQYEGNSERTPDPERRMRLKWIRASIEHFGSCETCSYEKCDRPWVWENGKKIKICLPNQHYLVVLGKRKNDLLLVTAFYIDRDHYFRKIEKEYNNPDFSKKIQ